MLQCYLITTIKNSFLPGLQPSKDIEFLNDYRQRHALYRTDPGLQALTASAPLIAIWDDHEFENNVSLDFTDCQLPLNKLLLHTKSIATLLNYNLTASPHCAHLDTFDVAQGLNNPVEQEIIGYDD